MSDLHAQLLAATSPLAVAETRAPEELAAALRAVVELHSPRPCGFSECHAPTTHMLCWACGSGIAIEDCQTLLAIARRLGIGEHKSVNEKEADRG